MCVSSHSKTCENAANASSPRLGCCSYHWPYPDVCLSLCRFFPVYIKLPVAPLVLREPNVQTCLRCPSLCFASSSPERSLRVPKLFSSSGGRRHLTVMASSTEASPIDLHSAHTGLNALSRCPPLLSIGPLSTFLVPRIISSRTKSS